MSFDLTNEFIDQTYQRLVQVSGSNLVDGTGSVINPTIKNAATASYVELVNVDGFSVYSGSVSTRVTDLETFSSSLNANFVNETEFSIYTGSVDGQITGLDGRVTTLENKQDYTGSFTGSFFGDGTGLTGITTTTALTASYVQLGNVDGFTPYSSSVSTRLTGLENFSSSLDATFATDAELSAVSGSLATSINLVSTDLNNISGSLSGRVTDLEAFSSSLDATFATDAELTQVSSSLAGGITGLDTRVGTLEGKTLVSGSNQITLQNTIGNLSGSRIDGPVGTANSASYVDFTNVDNVPDFILETDFNNYTGSVNTFSGSFSTRVTDLESFSSSLDATFATDAELSAVSGSLAASITQVGSDLSTISGSLAGRTSELEASSSFFARVDQNNTFTGDQTFNNIQVNGTGSFAYIQAVTGSAKIIGDAFIVLNVAQPPLRYAGIKVVDSGSTSGLTGSFIYDAEADHWGYESVDNYVAAFLSGPTGSVGNFIYNTSNKVLKSAGQNYVVDSSITDNGSNVVLTTPLSGTEITGSLIKATTSFIGNLQGNASTATSASHALASDTSISASHALNADNSTTAGFSTTAGTANTASYVDFPNVDNVPNFVLESTFDTYTGSVDTFSGSFSTRITDLESFSSSLDATFATDAELSAVSSSLANSITAVDVSLTNLSSSVASEITALQNFSSSLDATFATDAELAAVSSSFAIEVTGLDGRLDVLEGKTLVSGSSQITLQNTTGNLSGSRIDGPVPTATSASHAVNADNALLANFATTAGTANTASYVDYSNIGNKPTLVSGSSQIILQNTIGNLSGSRIDGDVATAVSSSHAINSDTASFATTADTATSASYAVTASYALNSIPPFPYTGNASISGSLLVDGNITVVTGSLISTARLSTQLGEGLVIDGLDGGIVFKGGASSTFENKVVFEDGINVNAIAAQTAGIDGPDITITPYVSGKVVLASDAAVSNNLVVTGSVTGSFFTGDGSALTNLLSASHAVNADNAISSSYALTASFALNAGTTTDSFSTIAVAGQSNVVADSPTDTLTLIAGTNVTITTDAATDSITIDASGGQGFPFTGDAVITGSLEVTGVISGSAFSGDGSGLTNLPPATVDFVQVSLYSQVFG